MNVKLNKFNYIVEYSIIGGIDNSIELETNIVDDTILDYKLIDGVLKYNPIPKEKPEGIKWYTLVLSG